MVRYKPSSANYFEVSPSKNRSLRTRFASHSTVDVGPTANSCSSSGLSGTPDTGLDQYLRRRNRSPDRAAPNDLTFHTFSEDSTVQGPSHSDLQRKSAEHWSEIRSLLQHTVIETRIPPPLLICCV